MQNVEILPAGHPSFGTRCAVFMFVIGQDRRVLSVEATNEWAVLCLERLLLTDGKVSNTCEILQVVRDYRNVGTRSEMVEEVPFTDFMVDIVDPHRVTGDSIVSTAFRNSLTDEECQYVQHKLEISQDLTEDIFEGFDMLDTPVYTNPAPQLPQFKGPDQTDQLTSALVNLGFKKAEVRKVVASLEDRVRTEDLHSLIREGLRQLAA